MCKVYRVGRSIGKQYLKYLAECGRWSWQIERTGWLWFSALSLISYNYVNTALLVSTCFFLVMCLRGLTLSFSRHLSAWCWSDIARLKFLYFRSVISLMVLFLWRSDVRNLFSYSKTFLLFNWDGEWSTKQWTNLLWCYMSFSSGFACDVQFVGYHVCPRSMCRFLAFRKRPWLHVWGWLWGRHTHHPGLETCIFQVANERQ